MKKHLRHRLAIVLTMALVMGLPASPVIAAAPEYEESSTAASPDSGTAEDSHTSSDDGKNHDKDQDKKHSKNEEKDHDSHDKAEEPDEEKLSSESDHSLSEEKKKEEHSQDPSKDKKESKDWAERIDSPDYAKKLYDILSADKEDNAGAENCLIQDSYFTLPPSSSSSPAAEQDVTQIESLNFGLIDLFAGEDVLLTPSLFAAEDFYQIEPAPGDRQVDYASLRRGDVVCTPSFNGIFVTSIAKDADYDQKKTEVCSHISDVFQAFDRDHPEVFWLSGKCRVRMPVVRSAGGTEQAYFFLVLADQDGFTMRSPDWISDGSVADGIRRRDQAAEQILSTVTADTPVEIVRQLNRWLTEHNQYNTTPDLTSIGNEPHECLSALEGRTGRNGPVCDGYSRAFKVLCDQLDIPCILENGYAKTSPDSTGIFHMWNAVQINGKWYGVDVTWNDPVVQGVNRAKSGRENEQFLLAGSAAVIRGMTFTDSHMVTNQASADGTAFVNGPSLSASSFPFDHFEK